MTSRLEGVAVVTGAGRGIGAAIARDLSRRGASVGLCSRTAAELDAVREGLTAGGGRAVPVVADVTREDDVVRLFDEVERELGPVRYLVNNVGNVEVGPTAEVGLESWEGTLAGNLTSAFLCCREAFRRMPSAGGGAIVNISSGAGKHGHAGWAAYCAAKSGLHGLGRALAIEGVPLGIRVNTVCPGGTRTGLRASLFGEEPPGTLLEPEEVAEVVGFLLSDAAREVRGAELDVRKPKP